MVINERRESLRPTVDNRDDLNRGWGRDNSVFTVSFPNSPHFHTAYYNS